jgi:adenosylhomocysteine nucleosidase
VVLSTCGIGMISAAAVTEAVIAHYAPAAVLNCGCAGAHRADLLPGDIVVGERVVAYDSRLEAPDGSVTYAGMRYLHRGEQRRVESLAADAELLQAALRAAAALEGAHEAWPVALGWPGGVPHRPPRVVVGGVASADRWNRAGDTIRALAAEHGSLCEDMEAAAVALTCASHDVPFLAIKDIVNNELLRATERRAPLAEVGAEQVGRRAAALVLATLRQLAAARAV